MNNYSFILTEIETGINLQRTLLITALDNTYNCYILNHYKYAIELNFVDDNVSMSIYDIKAHEQIFSCLFTGENFTEITKDKCDIIDSIINSVLNCENFSLYDLIEKYL